jgi:hypothetical protein
LKVTVNVAHLNTISRKIGNCVSNESALLSFRNSGLRTRVNKLREVENISPPADAKLARRVTVVKAKPHTQALTLSTSPTQIIAVDPILGRKQKQG